MTKIITFIIGAGASAEFGFDTGRGLTDRILGSIPKQIPTGRFDPRAYNPEVRLLLECFNWNDLVPFRNALEMSGYDSIDRFLSKRPTFRDIGKSVIAVFLAFQERSEFLHADTWLRRLWNKCDNIFIRKSSTQFRFISFNYDRSLEFALFNFIRDGMGYSDEETWDLVRNMNIVHVHGMLGSVPGSKDYSREFYPGADIELITKAPKLLTVAYEEVKETGRLDQIESIIKESEVTVGLGFGFLPENLQKLKLIKLRKRMHATSKGLGIRESDDLVLDFNSGVQFRHSRNSSLILNNVTASDFIHDFFSLTLK